MVLEDKIRSFLAIELNSEVKKFIGKVIGALRSTNADVKYVEPDAMHLTLRFLGEISCDTLEKIADRIPASISNHSAFRLSLSRLGTFGGRIPRVVWIGVDGEVEKARELHQHIESVCVDCGLPPDDKPFSPHITVGRVRSPFHCEELLKTIRTITVEPLPVYVDHLVLFKSNLTPDGPIYTPLRTFNLAR